MADHIKETILIIEDDPAILMGLELNLRTEGYQVLTAKSKALGLNLARTKKPDLILLDLMLPDGSGLDILKILRSEELEMEVLILTARGLDTDKMRGLKLGADDYITKPFNLGELLARIDAALRRTRKMRRAESQIGFGDVQIQPATREVFLKDKRIRLTRKEFELLLFLTTHPGRVYSREQLLEMVWGYDYEGTARTVDNFIYALRQKLEEDPQNPQHLLTVHGFGYNLKG